MPVVPFFNGSISKVDLMNYKALLTAQVEFF